ncbi:MAG: DUF1800 domain-containing protein [Fimbriimonadaceae bacterium]
MGLATDRDKTAHLLRRFGLGASVEEIEFYSEGGYARAVDRLLGEAAEDAPFPDAERFVGANGRLNPPDAVAWWLVRLLGTRRGLREKLTLFWHNHFATSVVKVGAAPLMVAQIETLRRLALGPFEELLLAVSRDPAMLVWLDNAQNVRGRPNENFAREVMELFTLGIGHYTEEDVREAARAFTGWSLRRVQGGPLGVSAEFVFRRALHDAGEKTVLGTKGNLGGEDVLRLLCSRPETSRRLVRKFFAWFVRPNPDDATVERFAKVYRDSGLNTLALVRAIVLSPEFVSPQAERAIVKSPVDFVVATLRQLGVGERLTQALPQDGPLPRRLLLPALAAGQAMRAMGMALMAPPDVSGWEGGPAWISSATMAERIRWASVLFGSGGGGRPGLRFAIEDLLEGEATPSAVAARLLEVFDAPADPQVSSLAAQAAATKKDAGAGAMAEAAAKVLFASPSFQYA